MKIYGQGPVNITQIINTYTRPVRPDSRETQNETDRAEISAAAQQLQELLRFSSGLPDVREEKVKEIRAQILDGTYQISLEALVDSILRELRS